MIPWWQHRIHAAAITSPELPAGEWVPRGEQRLDDSTVERLALLIHERHHGEHVPDRDKIECARVSGAFDDVYAIEAEILRLIGGGL